MNAICSHLRKIGPKNSRFAPDKLENHSNEGKENEKKREPGGRKEKTRKKAKIALLSFYIGFFRDIVRRKSLFDAPEAYFAKLFFF